ncbi:hypothetical protein KW794_03470 [Candidatus Saccharibacteria bacterium]|nr:hypothetical protein [Candidatus Saccharibacteria bacterium]
MQPIRRIELWQAEVTLGVAILLQFTISEHLNLGTGYMVPLLLTLLVVAVAFTAPKRHVSQTKTHVTISTALIALVSIANAGELALLTQALINGTVIAGKSLLSGAFAIFLTNIIVFALWYWELDSPGLTGKRRRSVDDFLFPQQDRSETWRPTFFDYLYLSITNSTAFSSADTRPLTHFAKALMSVQALIALITVVLVTARAVSIIG